MDIKPLHILLVEDHEDSATCLAILLRRAGHAVQVSHDGSEAVRAAKDHHFDVALCDIQLPDIDGCDLLVQLHSIQPLKAIALTGFSMSDDFARYRAAGFQTRLVKPLDFDDLLTAIQDLAGSTRECGNAVMR